MAKRGGKRKNAGIGIDFKRAKRKVGRKLAPAQNATDTTFKSASITMVQQSMAVDRSGEALTNRHLTLKETLTQCSHYSERVRRDAVEGLAQLATAEPAALRRQSAAVVDAVSRRLSDTDADVRGTLLEALRSSLLRALGPKSLTPFLPRLVAALSAALTHVASPVRADALRVLGCLADAVPAVLGPDYLPAVLCHFCSLLSRSSRGRSLAAGSLASLETLLSSLESLLDRAIEARGVATADSQSDESTAQSLPEREPAGASAPCDAESTAAPRCRRGPPLPSTSHDLLQFGWPGMASACSHGAGMLDSRGAPPCGEQPSGFSEGRELFGHLLACWSECGIDVLTLEPNELAARCVTALCRCMASLLEIYGLELVTAAPGQEQKEKTRTKSSQEGMVTQLLRSVAPVIPIAKPAGVCPPSTIEALTQLNVAGACLLIKLLPFGLERTAQHATALAPWAARLLDWVGVAIDHDEAFGEAGDGPRCDDQASENPSSGGRLPPRLPGTAYKALLDGVGATLALLPPDYRKGLVRSVLRLGARAPERSAAFAVIQRFWEPMFVRPERWFYDVSYDGAPLVDPAAAACWVERLPRSLWKLGDSQPEHSRVLLRMLHRMARLAPRGGVLEEALDRLSPQLLLLWGAAVSRPQTATREVVAGSKKPVLKFIAGPLSALDTETQELAADTLAYLPRVTQQLLATVVWVAISTSYSSSIAARVISAMKQLLIDCPDRRVVADFIARVLAGRLLPVSPGARAPRAALSTDQRRRREVEAAARDVLASQPDVLALFHEAVVPMLLEPTPSSTPSLSENYREVWAFFDVILHLQRRLLRKRGEIGAGVRVPELLFAGQPPVIVARTTEAIAAALQLAEEMPSLLRPLVVACGSVASDGANNEGLVARLRLLLALLQADALAVRLLDLHPQIESVLGLLGQEAQAMHDADDLTVLAGELQERAIARADILFGTSTGLRTS